MKNLEHENIAWATHQPALIWAVRNTSGPVLELGVGYHSTELLHSLCDAEKRSLISVDDDEAWIKKFEHMACKWHSFNYVDRSINGWNKAIDDFSKMNWGVVFIDQARKPISNQVRNYSLEKLANSADCIVAHDSDTHYEERNDKYKHKYFEYIPEKKPKPHRNGPPTLILSLKNILPKTNKCLTSEEC